MGCPPMRTRGRVAWPDEAQDTTTDVAGSFPQVKWICSGVPSVDASVAVAGVVVAALAGTAVAAAPAVAAAVARMLAPPAVSICRRDSPARSFSWFSGMRLTLAPDSERGTTPRQGLARMRMNCSLPLRSAPAHPGRTSHRYGLAHGVGAPAT